MFSRENDNIKINNNYCVQNTYLYNTDEEKKTINGLTNFQLAQLKLSTEVNLLLFIKFWVCSKVLTFVSMVYHPTTS